jgi:hypothetical protein
VHHFVVNVGTLSLIGRSVLAPCWCLNWLLIIVKIHVFNSTWQLGIALETPFLSEGDRVVRKSRHTPATLLTNLIHEEHALLRSTSNHSR